MWEWRGGEGGHDRFGSGGVEEGMTGLGVEGWRRGHDRCENGRSGEGA